MSARSMSAFTKLLAFMLASGVPLLDALTLAGETSEETKEASLAVVKRIQSGHTLSQALRNEPIFSESYVAMVAAGERSGALVKILEHLAEDAENQDVFVRRLQAALVYPVFLLVAGIITGLVFTTFVIPVLGEVFAAMHLELPLVTRLLVVFGTWLRHPVVALQLLLLPFFLWLSWPYLKAWLFGRDTRLRLDHLLLKLPVVGGLIRRLAVARFLQVLSSGLTAGVEIRELVDQAAAAVFNHAARAQLATIGRALEDGKTFTQACSQCEILQGIPLGMLAAGDESASLTKMARVTYELYEMEVELTLATVLTLLEPILIAVMGVAAAFLFLATILPTTRLLANI